MKRKRQTKIERKGNTQKQTKSTYFFLGGGGGETGFYSKTNKTNKKQTKQKTRTKKTNQLKYSGFKGQVKWPFGNQKNRKES